MRIEELFNEFVNSDDFKSLDTPFFYFKKGAEYQRKLDIEKVTNCIMDGLKYIPMTDLDDWGNSEVDREKLVETLVRAINRHNEGGCINCIHLDAKDKKLGYCKAHKVEVLCNDMSYVDECSCFKEIPEQ